MKRIDLTPVQHTRKIGEKCEYIDPNVTEDCIFYADGEPIGFYISKMPEKMCKLADLANAEFRSKRVPKQGRAKGFGSIKLQEYTTGTTCQIGGIAPQPRFGRDYCKMSSVHDSKTAQTFIKAMLLLAKESEKLINETLPKQYEQQIELFEQVPDKWKFGSLFTSSISNNNISASFHLDSANIKGCVNVIICKRMNSKGGDLHIPDYGATIGQVDNSILVYPAWRNMHGVTPIIPTFEGGYRNSLVFYPLKAFQGL
jgi:hypothetical protein